MIRQSYYYKTKARRHVALFQCASRDLLLQPVRVLLITIRDQTFDDFGSELLFLFVAIVINYSRDKVMIVHRTCRLRSCFAFSSRFQYLI